MKKIAILVPVCSRNQSYTSIEDTPLFRSLLPSFLQTIEPNYTYTFFIGYDDNDEFYSKNDEYLRNITPHVYKLDGCQHAPAFAWNKLADISYKDTLRYDYFFQIGDDVKLLTPKWTTHFIEKLSMYNDIGIVGPCNDTNYFARVNHGKPPVIENAFVSRKHLDIFGYFFHPTIRNWYCDDWINRIYDPFFSQIQTDYKCINGIIDVRYAIQMCPNIHIYIEEGRHRILKYKELHN